MCTGRLQRRVLSARKLFRAKLEGYSLRFHKRSRDYSAKADTYRTGRVADVTWGVVFEIDDEEKPALDRAEGVAHGYCEENVTVRDLNSVPHEVFTYVADAATIDVSLRPYSWYKRFVVEGARQHGLPAGYIQMIE